MLLKNVLDVQEKLRELRAEAPGLFAQYLDDRLLDVPLFRVASRDPLPAGVRPIVKDAEKPKGGPGPT